MVIVVGAGPAGLAAAAMLRRAGTPVVVLERDEVGAAWKSRYDRLHLHTVRWLSCLPGGRLPRSFGKWPARDRVIEYLRGYAERHELDVRTALERFADGAALFADGTRAEIDVVLAATGYRTGLELFVGHLGVLDERGVPLVSGAEEHPQAPGLHFVGYRVVLGGNFRQAGIDARRLAKATAAAA